MKKIKRNLLILILLFSSIFVCLQVYYFKNHEPEIQRNTNQITMRDIQKKLHDYFYKNGIELKVGQREYSDYVFEQLTTGSDKNLKKLKDYDKIVSYMAMYRIIYDDYTKGLKNENYSGILKFKLSEKFLNKTIEDIKKENEK